MRDIHKNAVNPVFLVLLIFVIVGLLAIPGCTDDDNLANSFFNGKDTLVQGEKLATRSGCAACHSYDGKPRPGPTWHGLYGSERPLSNGTTVVADEKYLRQAITDPDSQLAQGFSAGMMPTDYGTKFSDEQVDMLVALIKSMRIEEKTEARQGLSHPIEINIDPSRVAHSRAKFLPSPPLGKVTVQLQASAVDAAVPGGFKFHLASPKSGPPFTTVSLGKGESIPRGTELVDGIAFVEPGNFYKLVVVYENPTNKDISFYVGAPSVDPEAALPFARALCWCAAIPFKAPAGGAFYRTIKVGVAANTPPGAKAIVNWPVVRINESS